MLPDSNQYPKNLEASQIGSILSEIPNIYTCSTLNTIHGTLTRIGPAPQIQQPITHTHKKHLFDSPLGVVLHFSGKNYGEDPDYFQRVFQNSKTFYSGAMTPLLPDIGPKLLGFDDKTLTLIMEKGKGDLGVFFASQNQNEVTIILDKYIKTIQNLWQKTQMAKHGWPRHFHSLLHPQYTFLSGKDPLNYFQNGISITSLYREAIGSIDHFFATLQAQSWATGLGFEDHKPSNTIFLEGDRFGFIDIGFPSFDYHWLASFGNAYQSCLSDAPKSLFTQIFRSKMETILGDTLSIQLFCLGRMNRLAIPCNARNAVFMAQVGKPISAESITPNLEDLRRLSQATDISSALS